MTSGRSIVGIDLGTSNSCVAVARGGRVEVIADDQGRDLLPTVVHFPRQGEPIVGIAARNRMNLQPQRTVAGAKRLLGRTHDAPEIERLKAQQAWSVVRGTGDAPAIPIDDRTWSPQELLSLVLRELRRTCQRELQQDAIRAVLTVPANFTHGQRRAAMDAAALAGIHVERLLNEPTAAAMAYGMLGSKSETLAVFDLGGGTFDVTVMDVRGNVFEVRATAGDAFLGGTDIDEGVAALLAERLRETYDIAVSPEHIPRLLPAAERIKIELSSQPEALAEVAGPWLGIDDKRLFQVRFTREDVEAIARPLLERALALCHVALGQARKAPREIDRVILVGGATRMPLVRDMVEQAFGKAPLSSIDPERVVAIGAATYAAAITGELRRTGTYAAPTLIDVTPNGLGIETVGGFADLLIPANASLPVERTRRFSTARDNQTRVRLRVLEGTSRAAAQNHALGELVIDDLPAAPRGETTMAVTFRLNTDGMLEVRAVNSATGAEHRTQLNVAGRDDVSSTPGSDANPMASSAQRPMPPTER